MNTKTCTKCGETKPLDEFPRDRGKTDGRKSGCKECLKESGRKYREENKEAIRESKRKYREENKESVKEYQRRWYEENREAILALKCEYREESREALRESNRKYREENPEKVREGRRRWYEENREEILERQRDRYANDTLYRLANICRGRLLKGLKSLSLGKSRPTCEYIGCSWEDLKVHLEDQFVDGMTWENHGEWHIDHIVPLCSATTEEEMLKLTHYTNLQPLWAFDNLSKGGRV